MGGDGGQWLSFSGSSVHCWGETDRLFADTRKVLVSANAVLHIQRGPPDPQPARKALADTRPWKPCNKHLAQPGSDTAAGSLGMGPMYPHLNNGLVTCYTNKIWTTLNNTFCLEKKEGVLWESPGLSLSMSDGVKGPSLHISGKDLTTREMR